jgi:hypothetical protein
MKIIHRILKFGFGYQTLFVTVTVMETYLVTSIQNWDTGFSGGILNFESRYPI